MRTIHRSCILCTLYIDYASYAHHKRIMHRMHIINNDLFMMCIVYIMHRLRVSQPILWICRPRVKMQSFSNDHKGYFYMNIKYFYKLFSFHWRCNFSFECTSAETSNSCLKYKIKSQKKKKSSAKIQSFQILMQPHFATKTFCNMEKKTLLKTFLSVFRMYSWENYFFKGKKRTAPYRSKHIYEVV